MTLYELMNNTTIQGDVCIQPYDKDGRELPAFYVKNTDDAAYSGWDMEWEDWEVRYIYANVHGTLVIEIWEVE